MHKPSKKAHVLTLCFMERVNNPASVILHFAKGEQNFAAYHPLYPALDSVVLSAEKVDATWDYMPLVVVF